MDFLRFLVYYNQWPNIFCWDLLCNKTLKVRNSTPHEFLTFNTLNIKSKQKGIWNYYSTTIICSCYVSYEMKQKKKFRNINKFTKKELNLSNIWMRKCGCINLLNINTPIQYAQYNPIFNLPYINNITIYNVRYIREESFFSIGKKEMVLIDKTWMKR